ncbi:MAG: fructose bisphosphate aldolase [Firmicutes bacterium]|nr:fructose bisphosphate aldolase [Bacillota bacterium]
MEQRLLEKMKNGKGFIAALDQSGGSTPKALKVYGIEESEYSNEEEMYDLVHEMRTRIITSPEFNSGSILGAILFKQTMERTIEGKYTADYLLSKDILPFLKIDLGMSEVEDDVQLMKPISGLAELLEEAVGYHVFGTKMRSLIKAANRVGIEKVVKQQFELARQIIASGLVPIIEPEVDINAPDKEEAEKILKEETYKELAALNESDRVVFKLTIPTVVNFYEDLMHEKHTLRVVALSGGYTQKDACEKLAENKGLIASFSRAFAEGTSVHQTDEEFNETLRKSIKLIYDASIA